MNFFQKLKSCENQEKILKPLLKYSYLNFIPNSFIKVLYLSYICFISHILDVWENEWLYKC